MQRVFAAAAAILFTALASWSGNRALAQPNPSPPAPGPAPDSPLASAPGLVEGKLPNGLAYLILRHANPPGGGQAWLHVNAGSINESEGQGGLAHFVEHLAFEGSENFPPGTVAPMLESMGMVFERHAFSSTGFDQASFQLTLPDAKPETFDTGLLFLADIAGRLTFPEPGIEQERSIVLEERRRGLSSDRRLLDIVTPRLAPGSLLATRPIAGTDQTLKGVTRRDLLDFYSRWFVPGLMTVIVVADADPAMVAERIAAAFGGLPAHAVPAAPDPRVVPTSGVTAVVATDREVEGARVALARVAPAAPPISTVGAWRRQLVERLAVQAFNRRMADRVSLGRVSFSECAAQVGQIGRAMRRAEVEAAGPAAKWADTLADLTAQVRLACESGFDAAELARVREQALTTARRSAATEQVRPAAQVVRLIDGAVGAGEPYMSSAQELELGTRLLPTITDQEISRAFADLFDPANSTIVLTLPSSAPPVTEEQLLTAGAGAAAAPATEEPSPRSRAVLDQLPREGEIAESDRNTGSSVLSLWLSNNVRVHYRLMEHRHETVSITVLIPGGELRETASNRGITRAAAEAFRVPATATRTAAEIQSILSSRGASCTPGVSADAFGFTITGTPDGIEAGFQLAYAMLTDPRLTDDAVDQWKARQLQALAKMQSDPSGVFAALMPDAIYPPGEVRPRVLTTEQVGAVTPDAARAWLNDAVRTTPLEVSIVGRLDEARATALALRYFGSLPSRPRISSTLFADLRALPRPKGERNFRRECPPGTDQARVMAGFFGPDASNVRDTRLVSLAARVLTSRMSKVLRDENKLAASIVTNVAPGEAYPGYGLVYAAAPTAARNSGELSASIASMFDEFAKTGPTPDEMKAVRRDVNLQTMTELLEPDYWTDQLRDLDYRGTRLDDLVNAPEAYQAYTAEEIREAFARYRMAGPSVRVEVVPAPAPPASK